jgi:hypothetical protein
MDDLARTNDNLIRKRRTELASGRVGGYAGYVSEASDDDQSLDRTFRTTNGGGSPASAALSSTQRECNGIIRSGSCVFLGLALNSPDTSDIGCCVPPPSSLCHNNGSFATLDSCLAPPPLAVMIINKVYCFLFVWRRRRRRKRAGSQNF